MRQFPRPVVVVSRCLEFDSCRWNGLMISSTEVRALVPLVEFIPVCPEVEIGLGVPRKPIRVVERKGVQRLVQSETERDLTADMRDFSADWLGRLGEVDGFILKDRSPSCGIKDVKVYPSIGKVSALHTKGTGFFGQAVEARFGHLAVETEGRLYDQRLRRHFYTKLFTMAEFRALKKNPSAKELVRFHSDNKYLLMAYNQSVLKQMGRVVANHEKISPAAQCEAYDLLLRQALAKPPRVTSIINVLQHCLGYFSGKLAPKEKKFFLEQTEKYRDGRLPQGVLNALLYSWVMRFNEEYLEPQTFFRPFPEALEEKTEH